MTRLPGGQPGARKGPVSPPIPVPDHGPAAGSPVPEPAALFFSPLDRSELHQKLTMLADAPEKSQGTAEARFSGKREEQ